MGTPLIILQTILDLFVQTAIVSQRHLGVKIEAVAEKHEDCVNMVDLNISYMHIIDYSFLAQW